MSDRSIFALWEAQDELDKIVTKIESELQEVTAESLGLDPRCGTLYIGADFIATTYESEDRTVRYYGGFEYVDDEHVTRIGNLTLYSIEDDRIQGCFDRLNDEEEED